MKENKRCNNLITIAKNLRKRPTDAENLLWRHLRSKQLERFKFRRQEPIGDYVVDFVCFEKRLVIEVDGGQHAVKAQKDRDNEKELWLKEQDFKILRFWNNEVSRNIDGVLEWIRMVLLARSPSPDPSHRRRGR